MKPPAYNSYLDKIQEAENSQESKSRLTWLDKVIENDTILEDTDIRELRGYIEKLLEAGRNNYLNYLDNLRS